MNRSVRILGIESSCDECSASVVEYRRHDDRCEIHPLSVSTFSQTELHRPFGGVVPEIASRNHLETVNQMIENALSESQISKDQIDAIAVTNRPGLVGALLVGVTAAKSASYILEKPVIPIHHLEGHIASLFLNQSFSAEDPNSLLKLPALVAVISGGHTHLYLIDRPPTQWSEDFLENALIAQSRDDAAGEAFDKSAKILGLPYPGGKYIDQHSSAGDPNRYEFPRALPQKSLLEFSFSGLKTAVSNRIRSLKENPEFQLEKELPHLCASIQEAIVDMLLSKMKTAISKHHCKSFAIVGGVAANRRLREKAKSVIPIPLLSPPIEYCTDNAAMIASAGVFRYLQGHTLSHEQMLKLNAVANPKKFKKQEASL